MLLSVTAALLLLAFQPMRAPNPNRAAKGNSAQVAPQKERPDQADNSPKEQAPSVSKVPAAQEKEPKVVPDSKNGNKANEGTQIQRNLEIFTGLLVVVGFLQVIVLVWQTCIFLKTLRTINLQARIYERQRIQMVNAGEQTEQIIEQMRDTAHRQLRAYVLVWAAQIKFKNLNAPEVQVHFKNFGQTPAYQLHGWISIWIGEYPLKISLPQPPSDFRKGTETLGPSRSTMFTASKNPAVSAQFVPLLGTARGTIFIYGEVSYIDAFGHSRKTRYRLMHGGSEPAHTFTKDGILTALLKPDTEGNESD